MPHEPCIGEVLNCAAYLDEVVVYSDAWEQHLQLLERVFTRLSNASLVLNLDKCEFGKGVVSYLDKPVGQDAKIQTICAFPAPKTRQDLHSFFFIMAGYFHCFCKNFSDAVLPITVTPECIVQVVTRVPICL